MKEKLYEEKGPYYMEDWCEQAGDSIENGSVKGDLYGGYSYALTINGEDAETFFQSPDVKELILRDISYPVKDGHASYSGLDEIVGYYSSLNFRDPDVQADLIKLGFDEEEVKSLAMYQGADSAKDEEIECWIDYDINLDDSNVENEEDGVWEVDGFTYDTEEEARAGYKQAIDTEPSSDHILMYGNEEIEYYSGLDDNEEVDESYPFSKNPKPVCKDKRIGADDPSEDGAEAVSESIDSSKYLTKPQLIAEIEKGNLPAEYEAQPIGQGDGYKIDFDIWNNKFDENIVVYIPEFGYDESGMPKEDSIYSFKDFLDICNGNREYALQLLEDVDWQSPETLYDEYGWGDEDNSYENIKGTITTSSWSSFEWLYNKIHNILGIDSNGYGNQMGVSKIVFNATPDELEQIKEIVNKSEGNGAYFNMKLNESIKDYLPRGGFMRDDEDDKSSRKTGAWFGQGTDEQIKMAKIIAKVKFAQGDRFGRVTKEDLDDFENYKEAYEEMFGPVELDEGWKDNLKRAAGVAAVAGGLMAGNAHAANIHDPYDDRAPHPEQSELYKDAVYVNQYEDKVIDKNGNEWTMNQWADMVAGENPYDDNDYPPEFTDDEGEINESYIITEGTGNFDMFEDSPNLAFTNEEIENIDLEGDLFSSRNLPSWFEDYSRGNYPIHMVESTLDDEFAFIGARSGYYEGMNIGIVKNDEFEEWAYNNYDEANGMYYEYGSEDEITPEELKALFDKRVEEEYQKGIETLKYIKEKWGGRFINVAWRASNGETGYEEDKTLNEAEDPTENTEAPAQKSEGDTKGHPVSDFPINDTDVKIDDIKVRDSAWEELDLSGVMKAIDAEDAKATLGGDTAENTNISLRTSTAKSTTAEMKPSENKKQEKSKEPEIDKKDQKDRIDGAEKTKADIHEGFEFKFNEEVLKEADNKGDVITFEITNGDGFPCVVEVTNKSSGRFTADELKEVIEKENPTIWFNDADARYWFMDFSYEKDGKTYWISSDNIEGDMSKYELSIYDGGDYDKGKLDEAVNSDIDMNAFVEKFGEEYEYLYNQNEKVEGYEEDIDAFDRWIKNPENKPFYKKFYEYRWDVISSDREAVAFMRTLRKFGLLEEGKKEPKYKLVKKMKDFDIYQDFEGYYMKVGKDGKIIDQGFLSVEDALNDGEKAHLITEKMLKDKTISRIRRKMQKNKTTKSSNLDRAYEEAYEVWNNAGSPEEYLFDICVDVAEKYGVDPSEIENMIEDAEMNNEADDLYEEKEYPGLGLYKEFDDMPASFWKHEFESASKSKDFNREWVEYCRHKYEEAVKKEKSGKLDESYDANKNIYNPSLILQAYDIEHNWYESEGKGDNDQLPEIMVFVIDGDNIVDTKRINRNEIGSYKGNDNEYVLFRNRDSGLVLTDYDLMSIDNFVKYWNNDYYGNVDESARLSELASKMVLREADEEIPHYFYDDMDTISPKDIDMNFIKKYIDNYLSIAEQDNHSLVKKIESRCKVWQDYIQMIGYYFYKFTNINDVENSNEILTYLEEYNTYTDYLEKETYINSNKKSKFNEKYNEYLKLNKINDSLKNKLNKINNHIKELNVCMKKLYDNNLKDIIKPGSYDYTRIHKYISESFNMVLREADESSVAKVKINSVKFEGKEGAQDDKNWVEGKTYSFEEFQKLVYEYDYAVWNQADRMGYDKLWYTADITIEHNGKKENTTYQGRLDLGDGRSDIKYVSLPYLMKYYIAKSLGIDENQVEILNPEVPYDSETYVGKYGKYEDNLDKFIADRTAEIKTPKYARRRDDTTAEEIEVGDFFRDGDMNQFYRVTRRTKSSVWLEKVKSKTISVPYKNRGELDYERNEYPTDEKDDSDRWSWFDINKPFRLSNYSNYVLASQGRHYLTYWGGKELAESFEPKGEMLEAGNEQPFENPFKEGDILYSSWGYTMRLVDFYKVLSASKSFVKLAHLADYNASQDEYGQAGKKMPKLDQTEPDSNVDGRRFKVHIRDDGKAFVKINNYEWAEMWDGKPKSFDTYD